MISTWVSEADSSFLSHILWTYNLSLMFSMETILHKRWIWSLTLTTKIFSISRRAPLCLSTTDANQISLSSWILRDSEHLLLWVCLTPNTYLLVSLVVQLRKFSIFLIFWIVCITIITLHRSQCGIKPASTRSLNSGGVYCISILSHLTTTQTKGSCRDFASFSWSINLSTSTSTICRRIWTDLSTLSISPQNIRL